MQTWRIGDVTITKIVEFELVGGLWDKVLPAFTPEVTARYPWLSPHFVDEAGRLRGSFHTLVIQTPALRIVVDTCVGNDKQDRLHAEFNARSGSFLDDMKEAGFPPESIDIVLCTHMHSDHVGWSTKLVEGEWRVTFPNARYLYAREEFEYWEKALAAGEFGEKVAGQIAAMLADSVRPVFDAGQADLVSLDHRICDEVSLVHTPGHSPGHVSILIRSKGEEAVITGDAFHHPAQLALPQFGQAWDVEMGAQTRRRMLAELADRSDALMIGTHFATPTAGRVVRDGAAYRLDVEGAPDA